MSNPTPAKQFARELVETYDDWPFDDPLVVLTGITCDDCHQAKPCRPCVRFHFGGPPPLNTTAAFLPTPAEVMLCRPCYERSIR